MAAVSSNSADSWGQPSISSHQGTSTRRRDPIPDAWDEDDGSDKEDNQKIWEKANNKPRMPDVVISRTSTSSTSSVLSPPPTALQSPMRILKRPSSNSPASSSSNLTNASRETLAQREARYQAARERIFREGGTVSPESTNGGTATTVDGSPRASPIIPAATVMRNPRGPADESAGASAAGFGGRRAAKSPPLSNAAKSFEPNPSSETEAREM